MQNNVTWDNRSQNWRGYNQGVTECVVVPALLNFHHSLWNTADYGLSVSRRHPGDL